MEGEIGMRQTTTGSYEGSLALLGQELQTLEREKERLLQTSRDRYVLVKGEKIVSSFDSEEEALSDGYERFGTDPFLVEQVTEDVMVVYSRPFLPKRGN
jgi:flagellar hook-associated protein FlgK